MTPSTLDLKTPETDLSLYVEGATAQLDVSASPVAATLDLEAAKRIRAWLDEFVLMFEGPQVTLGLEGEDDPFENANADAAWEAAPDAMVRAEATAAVLDELPEPAANELGGFRSTDPDTSREAALVNYPHSGSQREALLWMVHDAGERGLTFDEARALGLYAADRRLPELRRGGWIEPKMLPGLEPGDRPDESKRQTRHGADATVYILTDRAKMEIAGRPRPAEGSGAEVG